MNANSDVDATSKVRGKSAFPQDINMDGQLYAKAVWSEHPHAKLRSLDVTHAEACHGVVRVITARDVPHNAYGIHIPDQKVLVEVGDTVRWLGDRLAIVVAESDRAAEEGRLRVSASYEPLPVVVDPLAAMLPDAPLIHPEQRDSNILKHIKIRKGDIERGFSQAAVVIEGFYNTQVQEHIYMQPEAGIGYIDDEGRVTVIAAAQWPHDDLRQISSILNLPEDRLREIVPAIGGAFGGREDMYVQHLLALCAFLLQRPVKIVFSREETMIRTGKRHPFGMRYKTGAGRDGRLTALEAELIADAGAYASSSMWVLNCAASLSAGPYRVPNARVDAYTVYTNNAVTMAMRGFGATQVAVAYETQMNKLADALGMDPVEIRLKNLLNDGDIGLTGNPMPKGVGAQETLRQAALAAGWCQQADHWIRPESGGPLASNKVRGLGVACGYKNVGISFAADDKSKAVVELALNSRGVIERVLVKIGAADVGMGVHDALIRIASRALGVDLALISVAALDTARVPSGGTSSGSRHTYMSGNAVLCACQDALALAQKAPQAQAGMRTVTAEYEYRSRPTTCYDPETGMCDPHIAYGYAAQVALVELDIPTGETEVLQMWAAHDAGNVICPDKIRGQAGGGVHMGVGYALMEEYVQEQGIPQTRRFSEYFVPSIADMPKQLTSITTEIPDPLGPYGAKGLGEMTTLATAPAIIAAIHDAAGIWIDCLPATAEKVWQALESVSCLRR